MSTQKAKMGALPPEPAALVEKREKLLAELETQSKTAQGTFLQVVRTMKMLVSSTTPGAPFDERLYGDVSSALERFMADPILPVPPALGMVVTYLSERLNTYGMTIQNAVKEANPEMHAKLAFTPPSAQPAPAPAAPAAAARAPAAKDGFESGSSRRALALDPEANPPPPAADPKQEQQKLEGFKAWMKNPSLGKIKG
ncbi:hypothetical protein OWM54_05795 [Myxococcus sp. MISCRS1]|jgi:hypothetical protein|uniref:hypothetical protein n=1 Tax=Myxococcus TaxID=32 RepID=UPI001CBFEF8C|nr:MULTISPECIES: hypothetical protein [unclassified Myxococcus]MBZ4397035.1 hypothetical protein [Myxococcus sp. AS-1-15]MBZ4408239.1 hypothetical protein [Myxococcus sp. XM-1-1-1]MCY0996646.1 hypothetical protein [Myxococcus sp. MISCRS1]BDT33337.1 hypothetical protein MFMH1_30060 [Myxococcus sp. MH1]